MRTMRSRRIVVVLCFFALLVWGCSKDPPGGGEAPAAGAPLRLAVATNFAVPAQRIAKAFEEETGIIVAISTGSSGKLFAQIENGAPFDVLLSADAERPAKLVERGLAVAGSRRRYALGQLALYGPAVKHPSDGVVDLRRADYRHLSIANPDTAPYGAAAREVLLRLDLWETLGPRIVRGENIGQAFQFVESGGADLGLVALSSVIEGAKHPYWRVPLQLHGAIQQDAVLVARDGAHPSAGSFMDFLGGAEVRRIVEAAGYGHFRP